MWMHPARGGPFLPPPPPPPPRQQQPTITTEGPRRRGGSWEELPPRTRLLTLMAFALVCAKQRWRDSRHALSEGTFGQSSVLPPHHSADERTLLRGSLATQLALAAPVPLPLGGREEEHLLLRRAVEEASALVLSADSPSTFRGAGGLLLMAVRAPRATVQHVAVQQVLRDLVGTALARISDWRWPDADVALLHTSETR